MVSEDTSLPNVTEEEEDEEEKFYSLKPYHGSIPSSVNQQGQASPKLDQNSKNYMYLHRKQSFLKLHILAVFRHLV